VHKPEPPLLNLTQRNIKDLPILVTAVTMSYPAAKPTSEQARRRDLQSGNPQFEKHLQHSLRWWSLY